MKISNNWLKDFIKTDLATDKIGAFLTDIGLEVEGIEKFESVKGSLQGIVEPVDGLDENEHILMLSMPVIGM